MSNKITIEVELEPESLTETGEMLLDLASFMAESRAKKAATGEVYTYKAPEQDETPDPVETNIEPDVDNVFPPNATADDEAAPPPPETKATPATGSDDIIEVIENGKLVGYITSSGIALDTAKLPWDVRINPDSKKKLVKTGRWKRKKNLTDEFVDTIETELHATMAIPAPAATAPVADTAPAPAATAPAPANTTAPPPPADIPAPAIPMTFPEIMSKITAAITAKSITMDTVTTVINQNDLKSLPLLAARPDLIPLIDQALFG